MVHHTLTELALLLLPSKIFAVNKTFVQKMAKKYIND